MHKQTSRRHLVGSSLFAAGVSVAGVAMATMPTSAKLQDGATPDADSATPMAELSPGGEATMPDWAFVLHGYQDPYAGQVGWPAEPTHGTRYIGVDAEIRNDSDAPLNFATSSIRLRASDGTEYNGGSAVGSESQLASLNMPAGDRIRGWIWFTVPEDAEVVEFFYIAPPPRLVISVVEGE